MLLFWSLFKLKLGKGGIGLFISIFWGENGILFWAKAINLKATKNSSCSINVLLVWAAVSHICLRTFLSKFDFFIKFAAGLPNIRPEFLSSNMLYSLGYKFCSSWVNWTWSFFLLEEFGNAWDWAKFIFELLFWKLKLLLFWFILGPFWLLLKFELINIVLLEFIFELFPLFWNPP